MDRGIWATWYDYPQERTEDYLSWLHDTYLPEMLQRPGFLWAAHVRIVNTPGRAEHQRKRYIYTDDPKVGRGNTFLLLFGGESAHTFLNPAPWEIADEASGEARAMLEAREGTRLAIFTEVDRVNGPALAERGAGLTPGPIIQLGMFNPHSVEAEAELCNWYVRHRLPLMTTIKECIRTRRLISVVGWAKQSILYEFVDVEDPEGHFSDPHPQSRHVITTITHAPHSPTLGYRIWPPVEGNGRSSATAP